MACADPGIFVRGGPGPSDVFFCFCFVSPQLILQKSNGHFQRKLSFSKIQGGGGGNIFHGGSNFFQGGGGGSKFLFPIENHRTCDFPGGSGPLSPPLDPPMDGILLTKLATCSLR